MQDNSVAVEQCRETAGGTRAATGDASFSGVKAQMFDASGAKVGSEFLVNTETSGFQTWPTISSLASGGFVVSWGDYSGQGGDSLGRPVGVVMSVRMTRMETCS